MSVKFSNAVTKTDWLKISVLLVVSVICWTWVWTEYQKPILPPGWDQNLHVGRNR